MAHAPGRRVYFDWLRGAAVVVMIEAHALNAGTTPADQAGQTYAWAMIVGGFAAPLFLFLSGVGVAFSATSKAAKSGSSLQAASQVARRGWQIFGLAFLFRLQSFLLNPTAAPVSLLKVDILNIMGPSMVAAAWLWGWPRRNVARVAALLAATIVVGTMTPLVRASSSIALLPDAMESYLRPLAGRANFVLFPWAAFVFGGAAAGAVIGSAGADRERRLILCLGGAGVVLAIGSYAGSYLPSVFEQSSFWTSAPSFFFVRLGILLTTLPLAFFAPSFPALERFGRSSLFVYWVHVELVYGLVTMPLHRMLSVGQAFVAYALFTWAMYGLVIVKDRIMLGARSTGHGARALRV